MSLSAGQKTLLRSESQYSIPKLAILNPRVILAAQITDYTGTDMTSEFGYGNVTEGSYTDVLPGMVVYLGSTSGAYDLGTCRARKAWTATDGYVGEESSLPFADGVYITVVDEMDIRPKHLVVTPDDVLMDVDVAYSDQHENFDPIVRMGGHVVVDTETYPVVVNFPTIAESSVYDSTISSYAFVASEGSVSNGTTSNPSLTISSYPTNGYIRVAETITAANGKSFTGYRYVFVFDPDNRPITDFVMEECGCDRDSGGWSARVILNDANDIASVRVGSLAVLFTKDYFDGQEDVVGLYAGRENILMSGWIYQYTALNDFEFQPYEFEIQGAQFWLSRMSSFPVGVELNPDTADAWTNMQNLTVDRGLFHFLHWRTTVTQIMDVYLTDDTRYSPAVESSAVNMWDQIVDIAQSQILAAPACNHNGMLAVKIPYNLMPFADRAAASTLVIDLEEQDYERNVDMEQRPPQIAQVILNGVVADEFGNGTALFSLSPGHVPARLGDLLPMPNLLLESQEQSNQLAGLVFARENNSYPDIPLVLNGMNRAFDIAPVLYGTVVGLDEYAGIIIPHTISYSYERGDEGNSGKISVEVGFEGETTEADAIYVNGDIPDGEGGFVSIGGLGGLPPIDPLDLPDIPPVDFPPNPSTTDTPCNSNLNNYYSLVWSKPYLDGTDPDKLVSNAPFSCKLRGGIYGPSYLIISIQSHGDAYNLPDVNVAVYGMLNGSKVATGTISTFGSGAFQLYVTFNVVSDTLVDGFQIELAAGIGTYIESVAAGSQISTGSVASTNSSGVAVPVTAGQSYAIDGSGGPWKPGVAFTQTMYNFKLDGSGNMGYDGNADVFFLSLPTIAVYGVAIDAHYARAFFIPSSSSVAFAVFDSGPYGDNTGTLDYILRSATIVGRALDIYGATLYNVCAP